MSQKFKNNILIKTNPLSNWENEYILFNFRFILPTKNLDPIHYKKVFNKIINDYSNISVRDFNKIAYIENNKGIIKKHERTNVKFINYLKEKYQTEFKRTHDVYRENKGMRAYGFLRKNILYLLEINPDHDDRNE